MPAWGSLRGGVAPEWTSSSNMACDPAFGNDAHQLRLLTPALGVSKNQGPTIDLKTIGLLLSGYPRTGPPICRTALTTLCRSLHLHLQLLGPTLAGPELRLL